MSYTTTLIDENNSGYVDGVEIPNFSSSDTSKWWKNGKGYGPHLAINHNGTDYIVQIVYDTIIIYDSLGNVFKSLFLRKRRGQLGYGGTSESRMTIISDGDVTYNLLGRGQREDAQYLPAKILSKSSSLIYKNGIIYFVGIFGEMAYSPSHEFWYQIRVESCELCKIDLDNLPYNGEIWSGGGIFKYTNQIYPNTIKIGSKDSIEDLILGVDDVSGNIYVTYIIAQNWNTNKVNTIIGCKVFNEALGVVSNLSKTYTETVSNLEYSWNKFCKNESRSVFLFSSTEISLFIANVRHGIYSKLIKINFTSGTISDLASFYAEDGVVSYGQPKKIGLSRLSNLLIDNDKLFFVTHNFSFSNGIFQMKGNDWTKNELFLYSFSASSGELISTIKILDKSIPKNRGVDLNNFDKGYRINFHGHSTTFPIQLFKKPNEDSLYLISKFWIEYSDLSQNNSSQAASPTMSGFKCLTKFNMDGSITFDKEYYDSIKIIGMPQTTIANVNEYNLSVSNEYSFIYENEILISFLQSAKEGMNNFGEVRENNDNGEISSGINPNTQFFRKLIFAKINSDTGEIINNSTFEFFVVKNVHWNLIGSITTDGTNIYARATNLNAVTSSGIINDTLFAIGPTAVTDSSSSSESANSSSSSSSGLNEESSQSTNSSSSSLDNRDYISEEEAQKIWGILLKQGHHNLLPFTFSTADEIDVINIESIPSDQTIIPEKLEDSTTHKSDVYFDVISKNTEGVKTIYVSNSTNLSEANQLGSYQIPHFTWTNDLFVKTSETEKQPIVFPNSCWISTLDNIYKLEFDETEVKPSFSLGIADCIKSIWAPQTSRILTTSQDYLYSHEMNHIVNQWDQYELEFNEFNKKYNANQDLILFQDQTLTFTSQGKDGKIVQINNDTLEIEATFSGLDSVFKIIYSKYHNAYILIGDNFIWKLKDNSAEIIYSIENVTFKDAAIDEVGNLALVFSLNQQDYFRVIANDFYKIKLNSNYSLNSINYVVASKEEFVALQVINSGTSIYNFLIFNIKTKELIKKSFEAKVSSSTTSMSKVTTTQAIEVTYPNKNIYLNKTIKIRWLSNKSINDYVKIELLDEEESLIRTISEKTMNTGEFNWTPTNIDLNTNYFIKITWISVSEDDANSDLSTQFIISEETEDTNSSDVAGMDWDKITNNIILITENGNLGYFQLNDKNFIGLISTEISNVHSVLAINERIYNSDNQTKVRVFVGSQAYLSDMWDSGIIDGNLTSMYYGGGNNLIPGEKYHVHIQTYTPEWGWSKVQKTTFVTPR